MLGIQRVSVLPAVCAPQMVKMNLHLGLSSVGFPRVLRRKDLSIDGAVLRRDRWRLHIRRELARQIGAVRLTYHEAWHELRQQCLLESIRQPIAIGVRA